jgi:PAS domain S-box-containing protein
MQLAEQVRALRCSLAALRQEQKITQPMQTDAPCSVAPAFADMEDKLNKLEQTAQALLQREAYYCGILQNLPFFANLVDNLSDAVITVDLNSRIQSWNRVAEAIYGWRAEEVIGKLVEEVVRTDYGAAGEREAIRQKFLGQGWWQGEVIQRRQDHTPINILGSATFLRDEQGAPIGVVLISHDITERKRTEATLREQRGLLQLVIDKIPGVILVHDRDHRFQLVNQYFAERSNCTPADVVGKTHREFMGPSAGLDAIEARDARVWATLQPLFIPEEKVFDYYYQTNCIPLQNASGEYDRLLVVAMDVTARHQAEEAIRRSEERFRQIVTTMQGGLVIYDVAERITYANERFCELSGYTLPELIGATSYSLVDPEYAPLIDAQLAHRHLGESTTYEIVAKRKGGQRVHWLVSGSPWYDDQHKLMGSVAVVIDITAQKQAESVLQNALHKERELSALKSRVVSTASHELRTPLASILAYTETLRAYRHKLSDEQISQRLDGIHERIGVLRAIIDDVLQLERLQTGGVEVQRIPVDLDRLCRMVIDEFQTQPDFRHHLHYHFAVAPPVLALDKNLMRQILANLVGNALKYSAPATTVRVALTHSDAQICLTVQDEGIGIPAADLAHLFQPFQRASNVSAIGGTGLGLVIVKEAVELHGGTITVTSQLGVGTTFTVTIPMLPVASSEQAV